MQSLVKYRVHGEKDRAEGGFLTRSDLKRGAFCTYKFWLPADQEYRSGRVCHTDRRGTNLFLRKQATASYQIFHSRGDLFENTRQLRFSEVAIGQNKTI
jgi:hypothetical protein